MLNARVGWASIRNKYGIAERPPTRSGLYMGHKGHVAWGLPVFRRLGGPPAARERATSNISTIVIQKILPAALKIVEFSSATSKYSPATPKIVEIFACGRPYL
jgi:hypothetical protein